MWDIIKIIFEVILAFILGIGISAISLIALAVVFMWPILIPIIVVLSIVGTFVGYTISKHK
jgi:hypothetical protein